MIAGRSPWLCQGTTPPGCTTRRRIRNRRSLMPMPCCARSLVAIMVSVTPSAGVEDIAWPLPSGTILSAGQLPACAAPANRQPNSAVARNVRVVVIDVILWFAAGGVTRAGAQDDAWCAANKMAICALVGAARFFKKARTAQRPDQAG